MFFPLVATATSQLDTVIPLYHLTLGLCSLTSISLSKSMIH